MADIPYFPFYARDWLSDPKVRQLTLEERGAYHELLAGMWTYGSGICGLPNDDRFLARFLGVSLRKWLRLKSVLVFGKSSPLRVDENGQWVVSDRLTQEYEKATQISLKRAASGSARAQQMLSKRSASAEQVLDTSRSNAEQVVPYTEPEPDTDRNTGTTPPPLSLPRDPASPESSADASGRSYEHSFGVEEEKPEAEPPDPDPGSSVPPQPKGSTYPDEFERVWQVYPRHVGKAEAYEAWRARRRKGMRADEALHAAEHYARYCRGRPVDTPYVMHASRFFGPREPYREWVSGIPPDELRAMGVRDHDARRTGAYGSGDADLAVAYERLIQRDGGGSGQDSGGDQGLPDVRASPSRAAT